MLRDFFQLFFKYLACYGVILVLQDTPQEYLQKAELKQRFVHHREIQRGDSLSFVA